MGSSSFDRFASTLLASELGNDAVFLERFSKVLRDRVALHGGVNRGGVAHVADRLDKRIEELRQNRR